MRTVGGAAFAHRFFGLQTHFRHQTGAVLFGELCHLVNVEPAIGFAEIVGFFQNGDPRESCLIDLEDEALEEQVVFADGKSISRIVVFLVVCVIRVGVDVIAVGDQGGILLARQKLPLKYNMAMIAVVITSASLIWHWRSS